MYAHSCICMCQAVRFSVYFLRRQFLTYTVVLFASGYKDRSIALPLNIHPSNSHIYTHSFIYILTAVVSSTIRMMQSTYVQSHHSFWRACCFGVFFGTSHIFHIYLKHQTWLTQRGSFLSTSVCQWYKQHAVTDKLASTLFTIHWSFSFCFRLF